MQRNVVAAFINQEAKFVAAHLRMILGGWLLIFILAAPFAFRIGEVLTLEKGRAQGGDAQRALERAGLTGLLRPPEILVDFGDSGFFHPSSVRNVTLFTRAAEDLAETGSILSPVTADGFPALLLQQFYATQTALESPAAELVQATVSRNGRYAVVRVFPRTR